MLCLVFGIGLVQCQVHISVSCFVVKVCLMSVYSVLLPLSRLVYYTQLCSPPICNLLVFFCVYLSPVYFCTSCQSVFHSVCPPCYHTPYASADSPSCSCSGLLFCSLVLLQYSLALALFCHFSPCVLCYNKPPSHLRECLRVDPPLFRPHGSLHSP